jgi:hypothetical protein
LLVLVDQGFLTGRAAYAPTAFYDTSLDEADVNHAFTAQLAWQAMPRLKLSASDVFTQSDEPSQADRLDLRRGRQRFTYNLLSLTGDYVIDVYTVQGYYRLSTFWSDDTTVTHTPGATASVTILKNNTLTLGYECLNSRTTSDIPGNDSTITGHEVTGTVSRDVTRDLTAGGNGRLCGARAAKGDRQYELHPDGRLTLHELHRARQACHRSSIGVAQLEGESSSRGPLLITDSNISYYVGRAVLGLRLERGFSDLRTGPELRRRRDVECLRLGGLQVHAVAERPDHGWVPREQVHR